MVDLKARVNQFVAQAKAIKLEETHPSLASNVEEAFLYQYVDEASQLVYSYEEVAGKENVLVAQLDSTNPTADLPDGFGGRQYINVGSNTYISAIVTLPTSVTVTNNGVPYIYSGFTGGRLEADIGFQWSDNVGGSGTTGWKPVVKVGNVKVTDDTGSNYLPGYDEVRYRNSYLPGKDVTFYVYYNYNRTGKVRFKAMGYARYSTRDGKGTNTYLTTIVEYAANVGTPKYFKLLATIADDKVTAKGKFTTTFKDIKLDDKVPNDSAFVKDPDEDHADVTRVGNTVTISLNY